MHSKIHLALASIALTACSTPQLYEPIPTDVDTASAPKQRIEMTAQRFEFTPEIVTVPAGTLVTLAIRAMDTTHGFALGAFGIDRELAEGETTEVTFFAAEVGEFDFECSHFCGLGHMAMDGTLVVE